MKNIVLSTVAVLAMSSFAVAGGDIAPVEEPVVVVEPVVTDAGFYLGLGYSVLGSDLSIRDTLDNNHDLGGDYSSIMFQAGYKFNSYVAVEGRYWLGLSDEAFSDPLNITNDFDTDADAWGIYVKPMYPVTDAFDIYGLLGYGSATVNNVKIAGSNRDFDIDGFSWGLGMAYSFTENFSIFADYVDFTDDTVSFTNGTNFTSDHAFDSWNFGVTYQF
jgi:opacity protein-like surface antigen